MLYHMQNTESLTIDDAELTRCDACGYPLGSEHCDCDNPRYDEA